MKKYITMILKMCKLLARALTLVVRVKILDVRCFIEERRCRGGFSAKLSAMYIKQYILCELGERTCNEALAICYEMKAGD